MGNVSLFVVFLLMTSVRVAFSQTFTLAVSQQVAQTNRMQEFEAFYSEVFWRMGYELRLVIYPEKRCGVLANAGVVDGLPSRVSEGASQFPNLAPVPVPLWAVNFAAYASSSSELNVSGWWSLIGQSLRVDCRIGIERCESMLSKIILKERLEYVSGAELGISRLVIGRSDVYIDYEFVIDPIIERDRFLDSAINKIGVVESAPTYLVLHKKHAKLFPSIIKSMHNVLLDKPFNQSKQDVR